MRNKYAFFKPYEYYNKNPKDILNYIKKYIYKIKYWL